VKQSSPASEIFKNIKIASEIRKIKS